MALFSADVNGDLEAWGKQAAEAATRAVLSAVTLAAREVYTDARAAWPVRQENRQADHPRGFSRANLNVETRDEAGDVRGVIGNRAKYTFFIKSKRVNVGPEAKRDRAGKVHVWTALVRNPVNVRAGKLAQTLGPAVAEAIAKVR